MPLCNMMAMQHRKNKRGLQQLSDAQKLEAITKVQKGETKAAVAREFGVPESTLRGWCKKAKLNGHCHSVMNKSLQVTSTMSPVLLTSEMAYRDCSYSKGSGSDEGSTTHPFSDEQEDDDTEREAKPPVVAIPIPEEQRRVLDWLNYGHYPQLPVTQQTPPPPPPQMIDTTTTTTTTTAAKPAQPVVTSSTCDDVRNVVAKVAKVSSTKKDKAQSIKGPNSISGSIGGGGGGGGNTNHHHTNNHTIINHINNNNHNNNNNHHNHHHHNNNNNSITSNNNNNIIINNNNLQQNHQNGVNGFGFYNWCKSNTSCGGYSSPVSPVSSDKNDSYDDEPLALIVPSKRRISDLESALKNQLSKMYQEQQQQQQQQQQTNGKQTLSVEEALQHGEVFLDWLRACSDPNVTVLQAMQIGTLIKNIRSSLERNQNRR